MKRYDFLCSPLWVGIALGTAWAVRGQFGHEYGAAWAGAVGSLAALLAARRQDWLARAFYAALAGAIGWGLGGMMSYGLVVGYGRATDYANACYGLVMLFVIGGLYGFLGGGLFGMALSDAPQRPAAWSALIAEMAAGGLVAYYFLIEQLEWRVNPPRSEAWAVCLGIAAALTWHLLRRRDYPALRVALFAGAGGGFGFAFGNFLQILGHVSGIPFNFWNVMEYSLGFFGGLGLAYGTLTGEWEREAEPDWIPVHPAFPLAGLVLAIPFILWQQSFGVERIRQTLAPLVAVESASLLLAVRWGPLFLILALAVLWLVRFRKRSGLTLPQVRAFFFGYWAVYIALSLLITGAFLSTYRVEQYLYLVNYAAAALAIGFLKPRFSPRPLRPAVLVRTMLGLLALIGLLAGIAIRTHGELQGAQKRFEVRK